MPNRMMVIMAVSCHDIGIIQLHINIVFLFNFVLGHYIIQNGYTDEVP
jgi:hypothetical protein